MASNLIVGTNSYIDVSTAQTYFNNRLFADAWTNATPDQQAQALVMATRSIDRQVLRGSQKTDTQTLQFPRRYPFQIHDIWRKWFQNNITDDFETLYVEGASIWADVSVPQQVLDACCEEALAILDRYNDTRTKLQRQGVLSYRIGRNLQETYDPARGSATGLLSIEAREILLPWIAGAVNIT